MKKSNIIALILCLITSLPVSAEMRIKILYGKNEVMCDVAPMLVNDRTMVPLRAIFEAIGAEVEYEDETRKITAQKDDTTVILHVDSDIMQVNGKEVILDSPAFETGGRTLVPIRACAESFGLKVEWLGEARIVKIKKGEWLLTERSYDEGYGYVNKYDENGNLTEEIQPYVTVQYTYDKLGNELSRSVYGGGGTYNEYDIYGNLLSTRDALGFSVKVYTYDDNRRVITEKHYSKTSPTPSVSVVYEYDGSGRISKKISNGYEEIYTYNENGKLISIVGADGARTDYEYDRNGNMLSQISSNGIRFKNTYDENGNQLSHETSSGYLSKYTYDENGNCLSFEDNSGGFTKYTYNKNNQLISSENSSGTVTTYTYDEHGNCIQDETNGIKTYYKYEYFEV